MSHDEKLDAIGLHIFELGRRIDELSRRIWCLENGLDGDTGSGEELEALRALRDELTDKEEELRSMQSTFNIAHGV